MKRLGAADAVGLVVVATVVVWWPGYPDSLNLPKLLVLALIAFGALPFGLWRAFGLWKSGRLRKQVVVIITAALAFAAWSFISALLSAGPVWSNLMGWLGRADGALAWVSVVAILVLTATLSSSQVQRLATWVVSGASIVALVGLFQLAGFEPIPAVGRPIVATMGNTNFAAGYFGLVLAVVVGRLLTRGAPLGYRIWAGVLAVILVFLIWRNGDNQGPLAAGVSLGAMAIIYVFAYQGRQAVVARVLGAISVLGIALVAVLGLMGRGPLLRITQNPAFIDRLEFWKAAWPMALDHPIFGVGPGQFALYVAQFRPTSYVTDLGVRLQPSAVHNVGLQVLATLGFIGLVLWLAVFVGAIALLAVRLFRGPMASPMLAAGVGGSLVGYLAQGFVSIDMLPLLVMGWVLAGMAIALANEPLDSAEAVRTHRFGRAPTWVLVSSLVLAGTGASLVAVQMANVYEAAVGRKTPEQVAALIRNPLTPCVARARLIQSLSGSQMSGNSVSAILEAIDIEPRCSGLANVRSQLALQIGDLQLADSSTLQAIEFDPLNQAPWLERARYLIAVEDFDGAQEALNEAARVTALNEGRQGGYEPIDEVRAQLPQGP